MFTEQTSHNITSHVNALGSSRDTYIIIDMVFGITKFRQDIIICSNAIKLNLQYFYQN